jgi:GTPase Era involved in 16S rRNA processing
MKLARRLFVVPLGNNNHGKTTMLNGLLAQGLGRESPEQKGCRDLMSPFGRPIDSFIFVRSYQETEKQRYKSVEKALRDNDSGWHDRELIIFPSHAHRSAGDIDEMLTVAHDNGFDIICVSILLDSDERSQFARIWSKNWDERWTVPNPNQDDENDRTAQLRALGCDLWTWICKALVP